MTVVLRLGLTEQSERVISAQRGAARRLVQRLGLAVRMSLAETEAHLQANYLRGGSVKTQRGGQAPLAVRSGALLRSTSHAMDQPLSGVVSAGGGNAGKYAATLLGRGTTRIVPRFARNLWIPIADNLSKSGLARMSPREAMGQIDQRGKRRLRFFTSRRGNLLAFLPDAAGGKFARGKNKGRARGKLLFVLKKSVEIEGTDAMALAGRDKISRTRELLQEAILSALEAPGT